MTDTYSLSTKRPSCKQTYVYCVARIRTGLTQAADKDTLPPKGVQLATKLLTEAFEKASELPDDVQDQLAKELWEEIEWESRWDSTLEGSQDTLERLAKKALSEYRSGKTKEMGFDDR